MKHLKTLSAHDAPRRASVIDWFLPPLNGQKKETNVNGVDAYDAYANDLWFSFGSLDYEDIF